MYLPHFEKLQEFAINDLRKSTIYAQSNFLVAMGIFNYIEILGSFGRDANSSAESRFDFVFEQLLSKRYRDFKNQIDNLQLKEKFGKNLKIRSVYSLLRCGMSHEYVIKTYPASNQKIYFRILGVDNKDEYDINVASKKCGLEVYTSDNKNYFLEVNNPKLIEDLNEAFNVFKKKLSNNHNLQKHFAERATLISLDRLT